MSTVYRSQILRLVFLVFFLSAAALRGQVSIELNAIGVKPFSRFADNINRDGVFGWGAGAYYQFQDNAKWSIGARFADLRYDMSWLSDLWLEDNLWIRQNQRTISGFQTMTVLMRRSFGRIYFIQPYADVFIGANRFYARTITDGAFFTDDTDNDGDIDRFDGPIDLEELGIMTDVELRKSSRELDLNTFSPALGLAAGFKIKVIKGLLLDARIAYYQGMKTSYFDYGSLDAVNRSSEFHKEVESSIPYILLSIGLSYSFE